MKPKVLHLIGDNGLGGSNLAVKNLTESWLQEHFDFTVLTTAAATPRLKSLAPNLIVYHYASAWNHLPELWELRRWAPLALWEHHYSQGFVDHNVPHQRRFQTMLRLAYGLVDRVLTISQAQRQWLLKQRLVTPKKIQLLAPASPLAQLLALPPKPLGQPLILGAYGRFVPQKGFDVLIGAMPQVDPSRIHLRLGGYGQDEERLRTLAAGLPQVEWVGPVRDLPGFLTSCDAIVIPSRWEPLGLVCQEAKAAGKPVIVSAVDGLVEQAQGCGLIVPPEDVPQLAQALNALPQQDLTGWGQAGRISVQTAWADSLQHWADFLTEMTR